MANSFTMFIDPAFDITQRADIARAAVDYIQKRTKRGLGIGGQKLGDYSTSYKNNRDFAAAGKTGQTKVNLTLSGEMLASIEVLDINIAGRIVIGFQEGEDDDKDTYMQEKGYLFLGLEADEQDSILSGFDVSSGSLNDIIRGLLDVS